MQNKLSRVFLMLIFTVLAVSSWAAVVDYSFTSNTGTYTEITGGTVLAMPDPYVNNSVFNAIPIGFDFVYDGVSYDTISVAENGFLAMGSEVATNNLPISSASGTNNVVAALARDIIPTDAGEISYLMSGTTPNRIFTVQWKNFRRYPTAAATDDISFQIQLQEDGDQVVFAYGSFTVANAPTAANVQVGLRGASNEDYNNRTTLTDWTATEAGTAATNSCKLLPEVYPPNGLTFTFSPAQQGEPPLPAQNPMPANAATNISPVTSLSWISGGGTVDGYKVYLGTNNPPNNIANGVSQTQSTYQPVNTLAFNTQYFWQIVPFNADGDALDCPVWSFTTWADPTITTFPYNQNFDEVTPPAIPLGWATVNQNNDAYTWESYADTNADTAPNAMRIRYNDAQPMDDWLVVPPLQLTAEYIYKISFFYKANSATYPEKLALYKGTSSNPADLSEQLWVENNIVNTDYQMAEVQVTVPTDQTIYLGFHGHSDANQFYLFLDSFSVIELTEQLYPPTELQASVSGNDVHLSWNAPVPPPTGEWITWCDPTAMGNGIGTNAAATFDVAHRYDATDLLPYQGSTLTHVQFVPNEALSDYTVKVWIGTSDSQPSTMVHSQAVPSPVIGEWNTVELSTPVPVPATGQLWIGFESDTQTGHPAGCDNGPVVEGKGNMINMGGWSPLTDLAPTLTYNWQIQGYVDHEFRALAAMPEGVPALDQAPVKGALTKSGTSRTVRNSRNLTREHIGYKVYRDGALAGTVTGVETLSYIDEDLALGTYEYTVTATYDEGESTPAGPVSVTLEDLDPPSDLAATVSGNDVTLDWTSPQPPVEGDWISWSDNSQLGNSIGTNGAANFDVAHRYEASDLTEYIGGTLVQMKFVPMFPATYTVKIWTGGSATAPGSLLHSQVVESPTIENWTTVYLSNPIPITNDQLWIGYNVNTTGGYPAGCDNGPQVEGKGNMMNMSGWTTLSQVNETLTYNWLIQGMIVQDGTFKAISLSPIAETALPTPAGTFSNHRVATDRNRAVLMGYKVYRDGAQIASINDPTVTTYSDMDLANDTYEYGVTAIYNSGESAAATVEAVVDLQIAPVLFDDGFEEYEDFALTMAPWTLIDQDASPTYGIQDVSFPNSEAMMAYIVFNPSQTTPPITGTEPYEGDKMAASFASVNVANSDWMITPQINLGTNSSLKFYAKSHTDQYGLERFRVAVSTAPQILPQLFTYITGATHVEAPTSWTEYHYDLSAYDEQTVYLAIRCVSDDAFVFYVDNFAVHTEGGSVDNEDGVAPVAKTELQGNYPNPFNPETTIRYSVKENSPVNIEIYNLKGQLVKRLVNETKAAGEHSVIWNGTDNNNNPVSSGVYFYRMSSGKYSSSKKMIMMK